MIVYLYSQLTTMIMAMTMTMVIIMTNAIFVKYMGTKTSKRMFLMIIKHPVPVFLLRTVVQARQEGKLKLIDIHALT